MGFIKKYSHFVSITMIFTLMAQNGHTNEEGPESDVGQRPATNYPSLLVPDNIIYDEHVLIVGHGLGYQRGHHENGIRLRIGQVGYLPKPGLIHRDGYSVYGNGIHLYPVNRAPGHQTGRRNGDYRAGRSGWHQVQGMGRKVHDMQGFSSFLPAL
jgi:hypothetical protein